MDCLFCKMVSGEIPVTLLHDDDWSIAFADIHPQAPVHVLVVPKVHVKSVAEATDQAMLGGLMAAAASVAKAQGLEHGFRLVLNTGEDGGQTVGHLHVHVLGGRPMNWPPG